MSLIKLIRRVLGHGQEEPRERAPEDGSRAYDLGFTLEDNPYRQHTPEHSMWRDDWLFSRKYGR
jgi:hypothetical protein